MVGPLAGTALASHMGLPWAGTLMALLICLQLFLMMEKGELLASMAAAEKVKEEKDTLAGEKNEGKVADVQPPDDVEDRAAKESEIPNFKGSFLGRFPLVLANFWTSDHLSERSRSVDAFPERARAEHSR